MVKVIIEYDPIEDAEDLAMALHGQDLRGAVADMLEWLRRISKWQDKTALEAEDVRTKFFELLTEHGAERLVE